MEKMKCIVEDKKEYWYAPLSHKLQEQQAFRPPYQKLHCVRNAII